MEPIINQQRQASFDIKKLLKASIPAYVGPLISAGVPAYLLGKDDLLHASYTSIGLPSLISTIICFLILTYLQSSQTIVVSRIMMMVLLGGCMVLLAIGCIYLFGLHSDAITICTSAFLGAAIVSYTNPLKTEEYYENK